MNSKEKTTKDTAIKPFERAGIIGLGLIGGSLARALKSKAGLFVIGLDILPSVIEKACREGVLDEGGVIDPQDRPGSIVNSKPWQLLSSCDVVFVCTPVANVVFTVKMASAFCPGLLTDVASCKQFIMEQVQTDRFIGGHPMAGSERHGYAVSSPSLFENAVYVLCLPPDTTLPGTTVKKFEALIRQIGAAPLYLDAATHDQAVAVVSHLPHIAAAALSLLAMRRDDGILSRLAAGGFRDITRIASSDPNMWCEISLASKDFLLPVLKDFQALVSEFIEAVEKQDKDQLYQLFDQAALYRNSLPVNGQGTLDATSLLTVYAHDRPGALGHVTTLLSEQSVHVVNIRICEDGCLQLMLGNSHQAEKAAFVLQEAGYECA